MSVAPIIVKSPSFGHGWPNYMLQRTPFGAPTPGP